MRIQYDVDIDVDVYDIYDEMNENEKKHMFELLKDLFTDEVNQDKLFKVRSLEDEFKVVLLKELFEKKSLNELQDIINNNQ